MFTFTDENGALTLYNFQKFLAHTEACLLYTSVDKGFGCNQEVDVVIRPEDIEVSTDTTHAQFVLSLIHI